VVAAGHFGALFQEVVKIWAFNQQIFTR